MRKEDKQQGKEEIVEEELGENNGLVIRGAVQGVCEQDDSTTTKGAKKARRMADEESSSQ